MRGMRLSLGAFWRDQDETLDFLRLLEGNTPTKVGNETHLVPSVEIQVSDLIEFETRPSARGAADPVKAFVRNIGKMTNDQILEVKDLMTEKQMSQLVDALNLR